MELIMVAKLSFEKKKFILKFPWKFENIVEVQRQFRWEFQIDSLLWLTIIQIRDKLKADGSVQNIHKNCSGRSWALTSPTKQERVLEIYFQNLRKSVWQESCAIGISQSSIHCLYEDFEDEEVYFQSERLLQHYHCHVRACLDETLTNR